MQTQIVRTGKEYSAALFGLSLESGCEDEIYDGIELLCQILTETPELKEFLKSYGISREVRLKTVKDAFESKLPEYIVSFVCLLCENDEISILDDCIDEYKKLYNRSKSFINAVVTSAAELTGEEKTKLQSALEKRMKSHIKIDYRIDPSLLGGLKVESEGIMLDGSLTGRIRNMREEVMDK